MRATRRWLSVALLALPGALVVALAFRAGGFFPEAPALVALVALGLLAARAIGAEHPLAGIGPGVLVAGGSLALLAAWTLASGEWGTQSRALLEYDRTLAYALTLLAFGTVAYAPARLAWAVRLLALAILVVAAIGLATRLLPETFPAPVGEASDRLSYPVTYWNALGLLCALGAVLAVHLTTSGREPRVVRVLSAAAVPVLSLTQLLTFSRGSIVAVAVGLAVLVVAGRPRALLGGALAVAPACAIALVPAFGADLLTSERFRVPEGIAEGRDVAEALALACLVAAGLRALLLLLDARIDRLADRRAGWRPARIATAWAGAVLAVVLVAIALGAPDVAARQYERFVEGDRTEEADQRTRLRNPGNNGRLELWEVALASFRSDPVKGIGAGHYEVAWTRNREDPYQVAVDAHSLYLEVLAELGVVGFALLAVTLLTILGGFARRARGPDRGPPAALLAAGVAWAVHAGLDWHWEMPVVTLWLFALGGLALAAPAGAPRLGRSGPVVRGAILLACAVLAITPVQVARSQERIDAAADAFASRDCAATIDAALGATAALGLRPEPFELMAYCDVRLGLGDLALRNVERAQRRDPDSWELAYGSALVHATLGRDPRPAVRRALRLNPLEPIVREAADRLDTSRRGVWREEGRRLPLPTTSW